MKFLILRCLVLALLIIEGTVDRASLSTSTARGGLPIPGTYYSSPQPPVPPHPAARLITPRPIARAQSFVWSVRPSATRHARAVYSLTFSGCWSRGTIGRTILRVTVRTQEHNPHAVGAHVDRKHGLVRVLAATRRALPLPLSLTITFGRLYRSSLRGTALQLSYAKGHSDLVLGGPVCIVPGLPHRLIGETPTVVKDGQAKRIGMHKSYAILNLNIQLSPDSNGLTNPSSEQIQAVRDWAVSVGLKVDSVSPDGLFIGVAGTTQQVARIFHAPIDDYRLATSSLAIKPSFYSNASDPSVPSGLGIVGISGLNNATIFRTEQTRYVLSTHHMQSTADVCAHRDCFTPAVFRQLYDVNRVGNAHGMTIGLVLWGPPIAQSDFSLFDRKIKSYADKTTPRLVVERYGDDGIDFKPIDGKSDTADYQSPGETAMDAEYAHGIAPHSHLIFWLAKNAPIIDSQGKVIGWTADSTALEDALDAAANAKGVDFISNSWSDQAELSLNDPFASAIHAIFARAAQNKKHPKTFLFASGDRGTVTGGCTNDYHDHAYRDRKHHVHHNRIHGTCLPNHGLPAYPSDDKYVLSVGGTHVTIGRRRGAYEVVWADKGVSPAEAGYILGSGSTGGGCSTAKEVNSKPTWQDHVDTGCSNRATPDVSADASYNPGAYEVDLGNVDLGNGTSLATPLWAGMLTVMERYRHVHHAVALGFIPPTLYVLEENVTHYKRDFHDIIKGDNSFPIGSRNGSFAKKGWDETTGWGSPDLYNLVRDWPQKTPKQHIHPQPSGTIRIVDSFRHAEPDLARKTAAGYVVSPWIFNGDTTLTAGTSYGAPTNVSAPPDPSNAGWLTLTRLLARSSLGILQYDKHIPLAHGLTVTFNYACWGGGYYQSFGPDSGADGISFYLTTAPATITTPGAGGGDLGYVGMPGAYLGIGFDEQGNFASPSGNDINTQSGPGTMTDTVTIRGPVPTYRWITTSQRLDPQICARVSPQRSRGPGIGYQKITIIITPDLHVTILRDAGSGSVVVLNKVPILSATDSTSPPRMVTFGFAGAGNYSVDVHEIRDLSVTTAVEVVRATVSSPVPADIPSA